MGWVFAQSRPRDTIEWLKAELFGSGRQEIREAAEVGTTVYMAVRVSAEDVDDYLRGIYVPDADGSMTVGIVVLVNGSGYKDMDENMGPNASRAPAHVLDALSALLPPRSEWNCAADWRNRCRTALKAVA